MHINDKESLFLDKVAGDDVAQVRTGILNAKDFLDKNKSTALAASHDESSSCCDDSSSLTSSCVFNQQSASGHQQTQDGEEESILDCIKTVADALNIAVSYQISAWKQRKVAIGSSWMHSCNSKPIDEFESFEELLAGEFPSVFALVVAFQPRQHLQKCHSDDDSDVPSTSKEDSKM